SLLLPLCTHGSTLFPYTTLFRSGRVPTRPGRRAFLQPSPKTCFTDAWMGATGFSCTSLIRSSGQRAEPSTYRKGGSLGCQSASRSEEHTSELQSRFDLVCRLLLE